MEIADLRVFLAVARTGGITKAALELYTVQSNVSVRVNSLERELGVTLFRRHARGVTLTAAGEQLMPYAERIVGLAAEAAQALGDERDPAGRLSLGAMETTAGLRLPPLLADFAGRYPRIDLSLVTGSTDELARAVLDGKLDGAFVGDTVDPAGLSTLPVFTEELALVTAARVEDLKAELVEHPVQRALVFRMGCSYRRPVEQLLLDRGAEAVKLMEFGTLEGILSSVVSGLGITLLPTAVVRAHAAAPHLRIHQLPDRESHSETWFVHRDDAFTSLPLRTFLERLSIAQARLRS